MSTLHYCINILMVAVLSVIIGIWHQDSPDEDGASCSVTGDSVIKPSPVASADTSGGEKPSVGEVPREVASHENKNDVLSSSVICWGNSHINRMCQFRNLYYLPHEDEFVFVHGEDTLVAGVPVDRYSPALMDLSSVADHNLAYFNYADVALDKARSLLGNAVVVGGSSLLFRRFHADNLMHVFHDDLLPVFHTLQMMKLTSSVNQSSDVQLVFMEGWSPGPYENLYRIFSPHLPPLYKQDLRASELPVRFADVRVGVSKHTTWYQYGFSSPQGPINGSAVTASDIRRFCRLVLRKLNVSSADASAFNKVGRTVVLLKREDTRLILNEFELSTALAQRLRAKVVIVAVETHDVREIIEAVTGADVLVGMHGSLLVLAMFLPQNATVIELFPYAVNPEHYTPYRTLAELPGMNLRYAAWRNTDEAKSVTHPARSPEQGGLLHLSLADRRRITQSEEVPPHLCCTDPEWLYRIYQDTTVDVNAIVHLVERTSSNASNNDTISRDDALLFPSRVRNATCLSSSDVASRIGDGDAIGLTISWKEPVNLSMIAFSRVQYEVWIQESGRKDVDYVAWMLDMTEYRFTTGLRAHTAYNVWIRCVLDGGVVGPFNLEQISCST